MAGAEARLMRAGSWQPQEHPMLLKTTSDLLLQAQALQQGKVPHRLTEDAGKTNSVDSSSTAAGQSAAAHTLLHDSATASLLPPLRQISLDIIAASELNRAKGLGVPERQSIFQDVFNELAGKDELAPLQSGQLYTLPSMQFLESMLSDFDAAAAAKGGSSAAAAEPIGGPLDLPGDAFDLPGEYSQPHPQQQHVAAAAASAAPLPSAMVAQQPQHAVAQAAVPGLRPTPFEQQQLQLQQHAVREVHMLHQQQQQYTSSGGGSAGSMVPAGPPGGYSFVPTGGSAAPAPLGSVHGSSGSSSAGSLTLQASMRAHSAYLAGQQSHMLVGAAGGQALHPQIHQHQAHPYPHAHSHHAVPVPVSAHHHSHHAVPSHHAAAHPAHLLDEAATHRHIRMLQQQQAAAMAAQAVAARPPPGHAVPGVRQPAVPQPAQQRATPRRSQAYADFEYEEAEVSLQTSKSGRVRKVASFTGVKRKLDISSHGHASESRDSRGSVGPDPSAGEVGSKGSKAARKNAGGAKNRKGRRTVCLNCGCHQTPQWRCGPLGPRTLCNACGVRYKKDLPLNCWPIRDGMVLPPGAVLPPGFVVPPGITIHTQPADFD